jgi:hypothetical protein
MTQRPKKCQKSGNMLDPKVTDYMQQTKLMTRDYYCSLLTEPPTKIVETRRGKLTKIELFLQGNAPVCCISSRLGPLDLFSKLKSVLIG